MKILNHPLVVALGVSTLCVPFLIGPFISPTHILVYHVSFPPFPLFASAAIYWGSLWLFFVVVLLVAEKFARFRTVVWSGIILFLPCIILANCSLLKLWAVPLWLSVLVVVLPAGVFVGLFCMRRHTVRAVFDSVQDFTATILSFAALAGVAIILQFSWFAWQTRALNPAFIANSHSFVAPPGNNRPSKIIWIVLDELSYQQVYEQRFPGIDLPAFDGLAAQSTVFTHVIPAGIATEEVVPSLFTGLPIDRIQISSDGRLRSLHSPDSRGWQPFDPLNTIFQDARVAGYATGAAGWFNPYCRILSQVLDRCFWTYRDSLIAFMQPDRISGEGILSSAYLLSSYLLRSSPFSLWHRGLHVDDYKDIRDAGDVLLADASVNFVFLHLPIPHPEGIYDRKRMMFASGNASYLDNLVLADQYLAHARLILERQHQWDSSVVIVMGDHSWRTKLLFRGEAGWTQEEEQASHGGQFDDRPAYIVKMPFQHSADRIGTPFAAVHTRALLDAILAKQLRSPRDLQTWSQQ